MVNHQGVNPIFDRAQEVLSCSVSHHSIADDSVHYSGGDSSFNAFHLRNILNADVRSQQAITRNTD